MEPAFSRAPRRLGSSVPSLLLSALLLILSYPPFDQGWLAWVALIPWLCALRGVAPRQAFLRGYFVGFLFFAGTVWWVGHVTVTGAVALIAYLALFFAGWSVLAAQAVPARAVPGTENAATPAAKGTWYRCLVCLPAAWALLEFLRNVLLSGFGWNLLAHTQWNRLPLIQIADLTGAHGVSFLVVLVNVSLFAAWRAARAGAGGAGRVADRRGALGALALVMLCVAAALIYGTARISQVDAQPAGGGPALRVAALQGNIPQTLKWDPSYIEEIWLQYEALTQAAAAEKPDLIVWPETAVPGFLEDADIRPRLEQAARASGTFLLVGVPTERQLPSAGAAPSARLFNSAVLLAPDGTELQRCDKIHLVPFGEFIPLKPVFGWLQNAVPIGDFSPGGEFIVFRDAQGPPLAFSVAICFEDLFPGLSSAFVRRGAQALFVITNDGWFGRSAASLQHLQASVFRAVEGRVWVVRAANTGWTGFVDPAGRRLPAPGQAPRFEEGVAVGEIRPAPVASPYVRWGEWFLGLCAIMVVLTWRPSSS